MCSKTDNIQIDIRAGLNVNHIHKTRTKTTITITTSDQACTCTKRHACCYSYTARKLGYHRTCIQRSCQKRPPTHSWLPSCTHFTNALVLFVIVLIISGDSHVRSIAAAPKNCILCDKEDLRPKESHVHYEEFLFEHQVTQLDAINALKALNESFYADSAENGCKSMPCTAQVMKYCLGPQFINDHCWCELGHTDEGLPFIPHICYVGEKVYTASVGSCYFYEGVKECCCAPALAKEWRHISDSSAHKIPTYMMTLWFASLLLLCVAG